MPGTVSRLIRDLARDTLSVVVQALMGHYYLKYLRHKVDSYSSQDCGFCCEGCEEFMHLVLECLALVPE